MPRTVEHSYDFAQPVETVFQQGIQKDYLEAKAPALDHHSPEILELTDGPEGGRAVGRYEVEPDMPSWAKKMMPPRNVVTETYAWEAPGEDGARFYTVKVQIQSVPVEIKGSVRIVPTGPTSCRSEASMNLRASIPIFGPKLEELVASDLERTMKAETAFMERWLAGRR